MIMASSNADVSHLADGSAAENLDAQGQIKYRIEYFSIVTPGAAPGLDEDKYTSNTEEPVIMEYVEVRHTKEAFDSGPTTQQNPRKYHTHTKGHSYITILSPAVNEALRCVVDYYPGV